MKVADEKFFLGTMQFDILGFKEAVARILDLSKQPGCALVVTANADHVVRAAASSEYTKICAQAELVLADGMPVVWAAKLMGISQVEKISGSDLLPELCSASRQQGVSVFFLGGGIGDAEKASENMQRQFPGLKVAGLHYPPFGFENDPNECDLIVDKINASGAAIVFVGVGSPKQEKWILAHRNRLKQCVCLGIGISISMAAGTTKRAPVIMQKTGVEWVFRLCQDPRRLFKRYAHDFAIVGIALRSIRDHRRKIAQKS